jgi:hypothetical protein
MAVDLNTPRGKQMLGLLFVGFFALACTYLLDNFVAQSDPLWLVLTCVLLAVVAVCFVSAGLIARKMRSA